MAELIFVAGVFVIALCLAILLAPQLLRRILAYFAIGSRLYLAGAIRIALGLAVLSLAVRARYWGYVITLAIIITASGLSIFFFALRRSKKLLFRLKDQSDSTLRLYAITGLALWGLLLYCLFPLLNR